MDKPFQRKGTDSNSRVGQSFEQAAQFFFAEQGFHLTSPFPLKIGIDQNKKTHKFDLGDAQQKIIIECKSHRWTEGDNVPSAKITTWDQAMFYFLIAPQEYRKILFVLKDFSQKRNETLAGYYLRTNSHLIPPGVEVWEYDEKERKAYSIKSTKN
jgi:hypothetical protein